MLNNVLRGLAVTKPFMQKGGCFVKSQELCGNQNQNIWLTAIKRFFFYVTQ